MSHAMHGKLRGVFCVCAGHAFGVALHSCGTGGFNHDEWSRFWGMVASASKLAWLPAWSVNSDCCNRGRWLRAASCLGWWPCCKRVGQRARRRLHEPSRRLLLPPPRPRCVMPAVCKWTWSCLIKLYPNADSQKLVFRTCLLGRADYAASHSRGCLAAPKPSGSVQLPKDASQARTVGWEGGWGGDTAARSPGWDVLGWLAGVAAAAECPPVGTPAAVGSTST